MKTSSNYIFGILFTTLLLILAKPVHAQQTQTIGGREFILHTVKPKETVYGISRQYSVAQDSIYKYNPSAINGIRIDETLKFPSGKGAPVSNNAPTTETKVSHVVEKGETLYGIAQRYKTTVEAIEKLNPGMTENLRTGTVLLISANSVTVDNTAPISKNPVREQGTVLPNKQVNPVFGGCDTVHNRKKDYHVALLLPFHTAKSIDTKIAVEFYGGFKTAMDSLVPDGQSVQVHVYDTHGESDSNQLSLLLAKPEMKDMDMIIGPLYTARMQAVSNFATQYKIPLVSPFGRDTSVLLNNPYVVKVNASEKTVTDKTLNYFRNFYSDANYIFIEPSLKNAADSLTSLAYTKRLKEIAGNDTDHYHFTKLKYGTHGNYLRKGQKNVVIFPCSKEITVKDFLTKFNKHSKDYDISLVGTEEWLDFSIIEADYYENLNLHVPTVNFFSVTDTANYKFIAAYQSNMKADPTLYSYKGYQVACYMMNALFKYGEYTGDCLHRPVQCNCPVPFSFYRTAPNNGVENRVIQLIVFENYRYRVTPY